MKGCSLFFSALDKMAKLIVLLKSLNPTNIANDIKVNVTMCPNVNLKAKKKLYYTKRMLLLKNVIRFLIIILIHTY